MKLEDRFIEKTRKVDAAIGRFNGNEKNSAGSNVGRIWDFIYITDVGGSLIRRYQKPLAERLGWSEKKLTIFNAAVCGIAWAAFLSTANYFLGNHVGKTFQEKVYLYPELLTVINIARIGYSSLTNKAIGAASIHNLVGTAVYSAREIGEFLRDYKRKSTVV